MFSDEIKQYNEFLDKCSVTSTCISGFFLRSVQDLTKRLTRMIIHNIGLSFLLLIFHNPYYFLILA